ncbi:hemagglutinin repeat-containing protein [Polaromonas sp.]|uniref:hemagglutinin repeat-containing protein n=1 Tax=Polaromonas sp. TaxID=1869339 RepID=UPI0017AE955E|nr:hemagglutinin repeat-containing protein [Polaromonas sp.]NMM07116.1 hypothetical protein [Polaromonas sp.]
MNSIAFQILLSDGFYEQRLVREQVAQLTGRRFLADYSSYEQEYQALMDAGITYAGQHQLRPGIALSAAQMAQLSSDIVWLVEQDVTLADGSRQKALVPQVYVRVKDGDLAPSGALLAGSSINLNLSGDLTNSGTIAGRSIVSLTADNVHNLGGRITGDAVSVTARTDLNNLGGTIAAGSALIATAGRDLNVQTTTSSATNQTFSNGSANTFSRTGIDRVAGLYVSNPGGVLVASAGRDVNLIAGVIANSGQGGITVIDARRNLNLGVVNTSSSSALVRDADNYLKDSQSAELGSQIQAAGNLRLAAGVDLNAKAASVQAQGALLATAGNNVNITAGQKSNGYSFGLTTSESDLFSSTSTIERRASQQASAVGASLGGNTITVVAGQDLSVEGSNIVSDSATTLIAKRNITVAAAQSSQASSSFKQTTTSGLLDGGGIGITIGTREQSLAQQDRSTTAAASTVASIGGNVTIMAGNQYTQIGSDVVAPGGDITILAKKVDITESRETSASQSEQKFKQSGLSLELTSPVISALQTAQQMGQAAGNTSDGRMKGLAVANSALAANNAANAVKAGQGTTIDGKQGQIATFDDKGNSTGSRDATAADKAGGINISLSYGSSKSESKQQSQSDSARGSSVTAGGNIAIIASGGGKASDLLIQGSTVAAGQSVQLSADHDIRLLAAANNASQTDTNTSSSGSIGVSYGTDGFMVNVSASGAKGKADGADTSYTNTQIKAGNKAGDSVTLKSGGDTTLQGAVIAANTVKADVGGNLNIESLQDSSQYASKQQSMGGSVSVGYGKMSGSFSASKSDINSTYASVTEQSGIKAGDGGFQVDVKGNTDLKGAVIASTDQAVQDNKNTFITASLTTSDLQNKADYKASSASLSVGAGQQGSTASMSGVGAGIGSDKGSASSTTSSGISGIAGNTAVRSTDAPTGLGRIFDADKVQKEVNAQMQITQAFSKEAPKAVASYAAGQAADLRKQNNEEEAKKWDEGGVYRIALHTAAGALGGGASGAAGAATSASAAPLMNQLQDGIQERLQTAGLSPNAAKGIAQGVTALTAAGVGAAVGGAQGAATALTVDANNRQLHPTEQKKAQELAAKSGSKYTKEQIEEQMRLMGNEASGVKANKIEVLNNSEAIAGNLSQDPGMPKIVGGTVVIEKTGQANAEIQLFIIANTKDGSGFIPGQSQYTLSSTSSNAPTLTNTPTAMQSQTANCANNDLACRSGVGAQQNAPLSQQTREAIADGASTLSRQAGVVAAGAVAVSSQVGPYGQSAKAVAVGATVIGFGADVVEQVMKPNVGQTSANLIGFGVGVSIEPLPGGKVVAPLTNEIIEAVKSSSTVQSISTRINEFLNPSTEGVKK